MVKKAIKFTVGLQIPYLVQQLGKGSNAKVISTRKKGTLNSGFFKETKSYISKSFLLI